MLTEQRRAPGDTRARSPLLMIGRLLGVAGDPGVERETRRILQVDAGIRRTRRIERGAVVLVAEAEVDAERGNRTIGVLQEVVLAEQPRLGDWAAEILSHAGVRAPKVVHVVGEAAVLDGLALHCRCLGGVPE